MPRIDYSGLEGHDQNTVINKALTREDRRRLKFTSEKSCACDGSTRMVGSCQDPYLGDSALSVARFKAVSVFLLAVLAAMIFWGFLLRVLGANRPNNRLVQGLAANGVI